MKPIPGYPGYYATDTGDIISDRSGVCRRIASRLHRGYLHVNIKTAPGRQNQHKVPVHRLVLFAFDGPSPGPDHQCRHLDGDALNNRPSNLCWGTAAENLADQILHGTAACLRAGEGHNAAKLSDYSVAQIRRLLAEGETQAEIAWWYGVSQKQVSDIANGRTRTKAAEKRAAA